MVIAPIPGQVITATGGYLFGWWGILWTLIGTAIGGFIVFWLARKFGRPLIEKFFKKSSISKFEFIFNKNATFIIFIIPFPLCAHILFFNRNLCDSFKCTAK